MHNKKGITYIEMILTIAIISYVVLGFTQIFLNSIRSAKMSEYRTLAYNKIVNWLEEARSDYDSLKADYPQWVCVEEGKFVGKVDYRIFARIEEIVLGRKGRYKRIDVRIDWHERGEKRAIEFSTIKAKYD